MISTPECSRCGCADVAELRRTTLGRVVYVRIRCGHCGGEATLLRPAPAAGEALVEVALDEADIEGVWGFTSLVPPCPDCGAPGRVYCTRAERRVRYLRCASGHTYKEAARRVN